jgi:hypothetical protein
MAGILGSASAPGGVLGDVSAVQFGFSRFMAHSSYHDESRGIDGG